MLIALPFDHVVLCLAKKPMLRPKERGDAEQIAVVSLENIRCMLELCRNRRRMQERADTRPSEFFRPKFGKVIQGKFHRHICEF